MWWPGRGNSGGSWPPAFPRSSVVGDTAGKNKIGQMFIFLDLKINK